MTQEDIARKNLDLGRSSSPMVTSTLIWTIDRLRAEVESVKYKQAVAWAQGYNTALFDKAEERLHPWQKHVQTPNPYEEEDN